MRKPLFVALAFVVGCSGAPPAKKDISIQSVKWPQLQSAIAAHKGKVVVVDLWAEF